MDLPILPIFGPKSISRIPVLKKWNVFLNGNLNFRVSLAGAKEFSLRKGLGYFLAGCIQQYSFDEDSFPRKHIGSDYKDGICMRG